MIKYFKKHNLNPDYKKTYNEELFAVVAPKYDTITTVLSFGCDKRWKQKLIDALPNGPYATCLDVACGTGDLAFALAKKFPHTHVVGLDLTPRMIELANAKNRYSNVSFQIGDMCKLPFANESFDLVTGGYALRNAPDLEQALTEFYRVLKPGGVAAFLDFSKTPHRGAQVASYHLLKGWGSLWGMVFHRNRAVYGYIAESLAQYPERPVLYDLIARCGFAIEFKKCFLCGMIEIMICKKRNA